MYHNRNDKESLWIKAEKKVRKLKKNYGDQWPVTRVRVYFLAPNGFECYQEKYKERNEEATVEDVLEAFKVAEDEFSMELNKDEELAKLIVTGKQTRTLVTGHWSP